MIQVELLTHEVEALRYLAEQFHAGQVNGVAWETIPSIKSLDKEHRHKARSRLQHQYNLIDSHPPQSVKINDRGLERLHQIDNPPPKDYWANLIRWFRSRWWSLPFILVVVGLPLIIKWIEMAKSILKWLGAID